MQKLFKKKLYDWILHQRHEEGKDPNVLSLVPYVNSVHLTLGFFGDNLGLNLILKFGQEPKVGKGPKVLLYQGQGVIHIASAIIFGVIFNIRDTCGWIALHWAAFLG